MSERPAAAPLTAAERQEWFAFIYHLNPLLRENYTREAMNDLTRNIINNRQPHSPAARAAAQPDVHSPLNVLIDIVIHGKTQP